MTAGYRWQSETLLNATVEPFPAFVILRMFGAELQAEAERLSLVRPMAGRQMAVAVRQLHRAAAQFGASAAGNAELPPAGGGSRFGGPPVPRLTTGEVASELGLSSRQVRNLVGSGRLRGDRQGREWLIETDSVAEELQRRRTDG